MGKHRVSRTQVYPRRDISICFSANYLSWTDRMTVFGPLAGISILYCENRTFFAFFCLARGKTICGNWETTILFQFVNSNLFSCSLTLGEQLVS